MIREYSNKDKPKVIELLRKNTPEYFDISEENDFENLTLSRQSKQKGREEKDSPTHSIYQHTWQGPYKHPTQWSQSWE